MSQTWERVRPARLGVLDGLRAFAGGIGFVVGTPGVWGYALVPAGVVFMLGVVFLVLGIWGALHTGDALVGAPASFVGHVGFWLLKAVLLLVAVLLAALLALCLAQPLAGFALEAIVRAQERALTGRTTRSPGLLVALGRSVAITLLTLAVGLPVLTALFLVSLLFPPAALVTVPLKFLVCAWLLAWDFLDYPLSVHGLGLAARLRWVGRNFDAFTAFGLAWAGLVFLPFLVLLFLPMGVAGATRLVIGSSGNE